MSQTSGINLPISILQPINGLPPKTRMFFPGRRLEPPLARIKARIVEKDEYERGERALLNLGHTFGHALEAATGFSRKLLHGEAVALGCILALNLSLKLCLLTETEVKRVVNLMKRSGFKTKISQIPGQKLSADLLLSHMYQDKKVCRGELNFIVLKGIGKAEINKNTSKSIIKEVLNSSLRP